MDLKKYLNKYCIKQSAFAKKVGLTYVTIYNIKNGKTRPSQESALKIEKATGGLVTVNELVTYQDRLYRCKGREHLIKEFFIPETAE